MPGGGGQGRVAQPAVAPGGESQGARWCAAAQPGERSRRGLRGREKPCRRAASRAGRACSVRTACSREGAAGEQPGRPAQGHTVPGPPREASTGVGGGRDTVPSQRPHSNHVAEVPHEVGMSFVGKEFLTQSS